MWDEIKVWVEGLSPKPQPLRGCIECNRGLVDSVQGMHLTHLQPLLPSFAVTHTQDRSFSRRSPGIFYWCVLCIVLQKSFEPSVFFLSSPLMGFLDIAVMAEKHQWTKLYPGGNENKINQYEYACNQIGERGMSISV